MQVADAAASSFWRLARWVCIAVDRAAGAQRACNARGKTGQGAEIALETGSPECPVRHWLAHLICWGQAGHTPWAATESCTQLLALAIATGCCNVRVVMGLILCAVHDMHTLNTSPTGSL